MKIKYTPKFLTQLEHIYSQAGYALRYEKGNFKSGYCILKNQGVIIVNQYYPIEGKINALIYILQNIEWKFENLKEAEAKLYHEIINAKNIQLEISLNNNE